MIAVPFRSGEGPSLAGHVTHPLKRLRHVGRVIVAAPLDPHVPRHLVFEVAASVEEAVARARKIHGPDSTIAHVEQPPLTQGYSTGERRTTT
jgi:hypothetical protein